MIIKGYSKTTKECRHNNNYEKRIIIMPKWKFGNTNINKTTRILSSRILDKQLLVAHLIICLMLYLLAIWLIGHTITLTLDL